MKQFMAAIFIALSLSVTAHSALAADQNQAREVARINNCAPKKISIYQQTAGTYGKTIYQVDCVPAKVTDPNAPPAASGLLIGCDETICTLLRPVMDAPPAQ